MSAPLPDSVRIFGIEATGGPSIWSAYDPDTDVHVEVTWRSDGRYYASLQRCGAFSGWLIEGPWETSPELAVAALHDLVRKLAGEIR